MIGTELEVFRRSPYINDGGKIHPPPTASYPSSEPSVSICLCFFPGFEHNFYIVIIILHAILDFSHPAHMREVGRVNLYEEIRLPHGASAVCQPTQTFILSQGTSTRQKKKKKSIKEKSLNVSGKLS